MTWRHEWKHEISNQDLLLLRQRLRMVMKADPYAVNGKYEVRSLYFDTPSDKVLREKVDGVDKREKFRIRYYNGDLSLLRLEKKSKFHGMGNKQSTVLTAGEVQSIVKGRHGWMMDSERELIRELYCKMRFQRLQPKTIVDYTREPFVYPYGNVRITLDYHIRTGIYGTDFLRGDCMMVPVETPAILEVKWDEFLPSVIRDLIQLEGRRTSAFSKYAACRVYSI